MGEGFRAVFPVVVIRIVANLLMDRFLRVEVMVPFLTWGGRGRSGFGGRGGSWVHVSASFKGGEAGFILPEDALL
jgi:hypothetical protein